MNRTQYITALVTTIPTCTDDVLLTLTGPKGGTRAIEGLTLKQATDLRDKLSDAIEQLAAMDMRAMCLLVGDACAKD